VGRLLRFYVFGGSAVRIASAVIRPGKGGCPKGALTHLAITKPTGLWTFAQGMYAFVCMPEYAPMQWHPFTICSGKSDGHVEFLIAGVGDWTQELAARCLQAQDGSLPLPRIALDGPYAAPAQSALSCPILVAVGAGVGITPFLSLMSSLISLLEDSSESEALPLEEAHFFWMTRSVDEFLFGRKHMARIVQSPRLRQKVHLHLHTTAREPEGNAAAYLFRQAVKRQSTVDKVAFKEELDARRLLTAPQLPWCWVNRSELDVMWLSDLATTNCDLEGAGGAAQAERPFGRRVTGSTMASQVWAEGLLRSSKSSLQECRVAEQPPGMQRR
jgi:NAD(P)H-flavin reductase